MLISMQSYYWAPFTDCLTRQTDAHTKPILYQMCTQTYRLEVSLTSDTIDNITFSFSHIQTINIQTTNHKNIHSLSFLSKFVSPLSLTSFILTHVLHLDTLLSSILDPSRRLPFLPLLTHTIPFNIPPVSAHTGTYEHTQHPLKDSYF